MHALFIVLNKTEYLDDILTAFVNIGITGATIIDSQGMASALVENHHNDIPIIGSLRSLVDRSRPYNKTIFTILQDNKMVDRAMEAVNTIVGGMNSKGTGVMFTVPVGKILGIENVNK
ncbi:hypothetical protein [Clostridium formicaceticum]|uniref:Uncharacterized protein n=1 Tax=Clostridium formicaceticum TaxID=1497 RepID=A0AAC9WHU2_9CLOT|nr:hypothetical protein [Clostridium formicaceticum]AOY74916.1 hypothetical protein BJL90_02445 [Clostridium formicaceticum]ARE89323.1 hypothetical protein CLFO_37300 [Clostridium formicaceticum]